LVTSLLEVEDYGENKEKMTDEQGRMKMESVRRDGAK
jgi:hypothetical protein